MGDVRIGSLFSGIGGLDRGLELAIPGAHVVYQVERDAFCRHILARHWPDARRFDDVRHVGRHNLPLCGGFPCVDLSAAGRKAGLGTEDAPTRSGLAYEYLRIINECRPTWVVVENIAQRWGAWVPELRRRLWSLGYASVPIRVRACDVGARHIRARVFLVAGLDHDAVRRVAADAHRAPVRIEPGRCVEGCGVSAEPGSPASIADAARKRWGKGRPRRLVNAGGRPEPENGVAADAHGIERAARSAQQPNLLGTKGDAAGCARSAGHAADPDGGGWNEGAAVQRGSHGWESDADDSRSARADGDAPRAPADPDRPGPPLLRRYRGPERAPAPRGPWRRVRRNRDAIDYRADLGEVWTAPWRDAAPAPALGRGLHGLPGGMDGPWRRAGWTGPRLRTARIHALGNSVVPACAEVVGRMIAQAIQPPRSP